MALSLPDSSARLVRGPRALLEAMDEEARRRRISAAEAWRDAAREWLRRVEPARDKITHAPPPL